MRRTFAFPIAWLSVLLLAGEARPQGYSVDDAPQKMELPSGLSVKVFAAEPNVRQPIVVKSDDRGRIWTVQYLQYPNPAGLKRVKVDRYSRTVYDRIPEPPPKGPRGDDRITICEDTDGDGRADRFHDFVTGLNLCTGLAFGHGGVFVLQVPYLLFYPDRDRNDVPDSDPEVLLSGFGMEDAQSLVNHLTWGPDGWLYGVSGSTSGNVVREVEFQQAVWRFHPVSKKFELFCEGGGNLFGLTFDADGNLFFSSNGNDLAYHGIQGGYYRKNFGKHGPLHNPYTFGFFEHLPYDSPVAGPRPGGIIYLGDALPEAFRGAYLCCDFLQHSASWWKLQHRGTTFKAAYGGRLLDSHDSWFCAPDLGQGADGAVYVCDFHDQRTAHPDPDANWDRSNGRIYRIAPTQPAASPRDTDLGRKTSAELVELLRHPNGWYVQNAQIQLAARRDRSVLPALSALATQTDDARLALRGLWGLYVSGGFDDAIATRLLDHPSAYVRSWTVRLLADPGKVSPAMGGQLAKMAHEDLSPIVRCQLAASARRLPGNDGLPIVEALLQEGRDRDDPYVPLTTWWALEAKAVSDADRLIRFFGTPAAWDDPGRRENALRLVRRYAAEGTRPGYDACSKLLATVPARFQDDALAAFDLGLAERSVALRGMGMAGLFSTVAAPSDAASPGDSRRFEPLTNDLSERVASAWRADPADLTRLRLALRTGVAGASDSALAEAASPATPLKRRKALLALMATLGDANSVPVAVAILSSNAPTELRIAALDVIGRHIDEPTIDKLLQLYPRAPSDLRPRLRAVLLAKPASARALLRKVQNEEIPAAEIPLEDLRLVALHGDPDLDSTVRRIWGSIRPGSPEEKLAEMRRLNNDLRAGTRDVTKGKALFTKHCATCHKLNGAGGDVGPDLTGVARGDTTALLANIVDPSAVIRGPFLQYAAVTNDGRVVSGVLAARDNASFTFVDAQNRRTIIPRDSVDELRELPVSVMPENILKALNPQEVRDLFGYLQGPAQ